MGLENIWIFEINCELSGNLKCGISGGFIIANSEDEARKKLYLDRGRDLGKDFTVEIYPITALDLNKVVHNLW